MCEQVPRHLWKRFIMNKFMRFSSSSQVFRYRLRAKNRSLGREYSGRFAIALMRTGKDIYEIRCEKMKMPKDPFDRQSSECVSVSTQDSRDLAHHDVDVNVVTIREI